MRLKNNGRRRPPQDFASRLARAKSDDEITALIKAASLDEIRATIAGMPAEDQARLIIAGNPERLALLKAKGIKFTLTVNAVIIAGGQTKHKTGRRWGKSEWIQSAFIEFFGPNPPRSFGNVVQLTDRVNAWLDEQSDYTKGHVTRTAINDAIEKWRDANASPRRMKD